MKIRQSSTAVWKNTQAVMISELNNPPRPLEKGDSDRVSKWDVFKVFCQFFVSLLITGAVVFMTYKTYYLLDSLKLSKMPTLIVMGFEISCARPKDVFVACFVGAVIMKSLTRNMQKDEVKNTKHLLPSGDPVLQTKTPLLPAETLKSSSTLNAKTQSSLSIDSSITKADIQ